MKMTVLTLSCFASVVLACRGQVADVGRWTVMNYENRLRISETNGDVVVEGPAENVDTFWRARSASYPLPTGARRIEARFRVKMNKELDDKMFVALEGERSLRFYDDDGTPVEGHVDRIWIKRTPLMAEVVFQADVPAFAAACAFALGVDGPDVLPGERFSMCDFSVAPARGEPSGFRSVWTHARGFASHWAKPMPRIFVRSPTPTENKYAAIELDVFDITGDITFMVDNRAWKVVRPSSGNVWILGAPKGGWSSGAHTIRATYNGADGKPVTAMRSFLIGSAAKGVPHVTLRDDGITLIDGRPFYPIGTYSVVTQAFNGFSFERVFSDLAKAGFNLGFTYLDSLEPAFIEAAARHNIYLWGRTSWERHVAEARFRPEFLAWYCGDDTANYHTPEDVTGYDLRLKGVDPFRLTCQADMYYGKQQSSRYLPYVNATDIFMPEIYPFRGAPPLEGPVNCVAKTVETVDRVMSDMRMYGDGRPKACWAILQYFRGFLLWFYWPTREQLLATVFAAVIRGAHGVTLYNYGVESTDTFDEKTNKDGGGGFATSPERFANACVVATRLRDLAPVLVTRTPADQPHVRILSGPRESADGRTASVVCLKKEYGGKTWLLAVNAGKAPVRAAFDVGGRAAEALWEGGRWLALEDGSLVDEFDVFGVHVYRIDK